MVVLYAQIEFPSNIRKCRGRGLQVDQIGKGNGSNRQADTLGADVVREQLAVEYHSSDINADTIYGKESVEIEYSNTEAGLVRSSRGVLSDHSGFQYEAYAAARHADEHTTGYEHRFKELLKELQRSSSYSVHDCGPNKVTNHANRNPATLESKLVSRPVPESLIELRSVIVDNEY